MVATIRITAEHGSFNYIRQMASVCTDIWNGSLGRQTASGRVQPAVVADICCLQSWNKHSLPRVAQSRHATLQTSRNTCQAVRPSVRHVTCLTHWFN